MLLSRRGGIPLAQRLLASFATKAVAAHKGGAAAVSAYLEVSAFPGDPALAKLSGKSAALDAALQQINRSHGKAPISSGPAPDRNLDAGCTDEARRWGHE